MELFYLINILDSIRLVALIMAVIFIFTTAFLLGFTFEFGGMKLKILTILSALSFFFNITLFAFLPSTKDAYMIYGLGSTIEYLKNNDTAKQLPDKAIKCLDMLMDEYIEKENPKNDE